VVGVETEDSAAAALGFGDEEGGGVAAGGRVWLSGLLFVGEERGKVVVEGVDRGVRGIVDAAGTGVRRAEVAGGVVMDCGRGDGLGGFTLPGALRALGGDEDPLAEERVVAAMGDEVERARRGRHGIPLEVEKRRLQV